LIGEPHNAPDLNTARDDLIIHRFKMRVRYALRRLEEMGFTHPFNANVPTIRPKP
jgi:hypothetical protein